MVAALSFHHNLIMRLQHRSMNLASLELFSEQPPLFRLTLMHGFQMFAVPAANKLPQIHHFHKLTSKKNSIYGLGRSDNGQRRESKVKIRVSYGAADNFSLYQTGANTPSLH